MAMKKSLEQEAEQQGLGLYSLFCSPGKAEGERAVREMIKGRPEITALMVMNDQALPGIIKALADLDLSIPDDMSLISLLSSSKLADMFIPSLTHMAIPSRDLGKRGVTRLVEILEDRQEDREKILIREY